MTDTALTPARLWKRMTPDQRQHAARAFWRDEGTADDQLQAVLLISQQKKFRPKTVVALDEDRKARHLASLPQLPDTLAAPRSAAAWISRVSSRAGSFSGSRIASKSAEPRTAANTLFRSCAMPRTVSLMAAWPMRAASGTCRTRRPRASGDRAGAFPLAGCAPRADTAPDRPRRRTVSGRDRTAGSGRSDPSHRLRPAAAA